jgi:DNA polymerase I-like protein with 3'-5' exonuclease and polymerase domains
MLHRNREDVAINKLVLELLRNEMGDHDWAESIELENNVLRIMTQQELNGVYFDKDYADELVTELSDKVDAIDDDLTPNLPITYKPKGVPVRKPFKTNGQYSKMVLDWYPDLISDSTHAVGGPFTRIEEHRLDINSIMQIKAYFLENGWKPTEYNFSKKTGQPTSPKLTEDSYGTITGGMGPQIKERLTLCHRRNQIQGWLDRLREDGRLSACANTCGTPTGRMRHSNVVNVPKAADYVPYGREMRSLFTVPKGYKLIGCDAEQLELRLLAHFMGDWLYIEEILSGDIHSHNQRLAGLPTRDAAKTFIYAFLYGAGDEKLGSIVGGDAEDGARLRKAFLDGLPDLKKLISKVKRAANKGWLKGLDGRKLHLRRSENGEVMKHKALNLYIQGAGAVVMKKAMVILDDLIRSDTSIDAKKVLDMHDEFQLEVADKDAEKVAELCERAIVLAGEAFNLRIPMAGQSKIGMNWAETH